MQLFDKVRGSVDNMKQDKQFANDRKKAVTLTKKFIFALFRWVILIGCCYIILGPIIGVISGSFFSDSDNSNPVVYLIPTMPTLQKYTVAMMRLDYWNVLRNTLIYDVTLMVIQVLISSMVGYGFARFDFPLKKLLFACVIITIVIPTHTIMLPLYMTFQKFDIFGIISLINGEPLSLLKTPVPMYILTVFGCGLRTGIYIYLFNQFFRGLPKEIEEAAFIDGAGTWYTYFRIMLINAMPSVLTVSIFSLVWQYNDMFYSKLFLIDNSIVISKKITTLSATISNLDNIADPSLVQLYLYAGVVLVMIPVVLVYVVLQKYFMEGVERSGIVG